MKDWNQYFRRKAFRMVRVHAAGCRSPIEGTSEAVWAVAWTLASDAVARTECWLWRPRKMLARERLLRAIKRHKDRRGVKWDAW